MAEVDPLAKFAAVPTESEQEDPLSKFAPIKEQEDPLAKFAAQPKEERGEPIKDVEIAAIAKKHNISPEKLEYLRSFVEFRGGYTETPVDFAKAARQVAGFASEALAYGVPQFAVS